MTLYHILNRGVDKRTIFLDKKDYFRFIHDLFEFNDEQNSSFNNYHFRKSLDVGRPEIRRKRRLLIKLHAFCLMPNHYHLLVSPRVESGISLFMKKLNGGYAKYLNEKYKRVGALFQGKYKSIAIEGDPHFSWIPYYIHFNPLDLTMPEWREGNIKDVKKALEYLKAYRWSSHLDYLGEKNFPSLTQREFFTEFFDDDGGYEKSIQEMLKSFSAEGMGITMLE